MSAPQLFVQAVLNRLTSRLGSGLADAAASLAVLAREAPEKLHQDWDLFWEEVQMEADRLQSGAGEVGVAGPDVWSSATGDPNARAAGTPEAAAGSAAAGTAAAPVWSAAGSRPSPQEQIDQLRALVAGIAHRLEEST
ncbi:MAG: hypothetical protein ACKOCM_12780 [Cyanobacteriota bacterium]